LAFPEIGPVLAAFIITDSGQTLLLGLIWLASDRLFHVKQSARTRALKPTPAQFALNTSNTRSCH
jgi:hypothetical protein